MRRGFLWLSGCMLLAIIGAPWLMAASQMMRIRTLMAAVSIGVFVITLLTIRTYKLREKYALLWLATAFMITLVVFFPGLVEAVRQWFGMQYVTSLVAVIFVFLVLVSFHFSIALSALNDKVARQASRIVILDADLADMKRHIERLEADR